MRRASAKPMTGTIKPFRAYGPTCDTLDVLPRPLLLPEDIAAGDFIVFDAIGAYSVAVRTDFNGFYPDRSGDCGELTTARSRKKLTARALSGGRGPLRDARQGPPSPSARTRRRSAGRDARGAQGELEEMLADWPDGDTGARAPFEALLKKVTPDEARPPLTDLLRKGQLEAAIAALARPAAPIPMRCAMRWPKRAAPNWPRCAMRRD